jgi:1-deoxyxylulose-5-phosphate synthase
VSKPSHLDNALAATELTLTQEDISRLETPYTPRPAAQGGLTDAELTRTAVAVNMLPTSS